MKIGFAGCSGHFSECLKNKYEGAEYVGYWVAPEENEELLVSAFGRLGLAPRRCGSYDELLSLGIDTVVVDGIYNAHAPLTVRALQENINVISEKPAATTFEQLEAVKEAVKTSKARLFAMFTQRYQDCFFTVKKLLEQGVAGEIRLINAQKSYKLGKRPAFYAGRETFGGLIPWVGIHMIDLILWYSGKKAKHIDAFHSRKYNGGNGDMEMTAAVNMLLENEVLGIVNIDYLRPEGASTHGDDRIRIVGTSGIVEVTDERVFLNGSEQTLQKSPSMFEGFLAWNLNDGIYAAQVALAARDSADKYLMR